jgi:hypothetical protein
MELKNQVYLFLIMRIYRNMNMQEKELSKTREKYANHFGSTWPFGSIPCKTIAQITEEHEKWQDERIKRINSIKK